jgi:hypothetical protein
MSSAPNVNVHGLFPMLAPVPGWGPAAAGPALADAARRPDA